VEPTENNKTGIMLGYERAYQPRKTKKYKTTFMNIAKCNGHVMIDEQQRRWWQDGASGEVGFATIFIIHSCSLIGIWSSSTSQHDNLST